MLIAFSTLLIAILASHGQTITTKLSEAYRQLPQLDFFQPAFPRSLTWLPRTASGGFILLPGAYTWSVQSYCINATKHGPRGDAAYLAAPLLGPGAAHLSSLLRKSETSGVSHDDMQTLVWTLTSQQDLMKQIGSIEDVMKAMGQPQTQARSIMSALASESAPAKNHGVPRSRWTYIKPGYFVRLSNTSYKFVEVEVYVPERWRMTRDSAHRIQSLSNATGSRVDLSYQGQTAVATVLQETTSNPWAPVATSAAIRYAGGANQSNAAALQQLEAAIRNTITLSPSWDAVRDRVADDAARTRAELVCNTVPCNVTPADFPHVPVVKTSKDKHGRTTVSLSGGPAFNLTTIAAVPSDTSLQSLAMSNRSDDGVTPPSAPGAKSADKNADCPEVADTIKLQKIARAMYGTQKYIAMATTEKKSADVYNIAMIDVIGKLFNKGDTAAAIPSSSVDAMVQTALNPPKPAAKSASGGDIDIGALAATDLQTCGEQMSMEAMRSPAVIRDAALKHEDVHADICESQPEPKGKKPDTPKTRGDGEVKAYNVSIRFLEDWYAANKCE